MTVFPKARARQEFWLYCLANVAENRLSSTKWVSPLPRAVDLQIPLSSTVGTDRAAAFGQSGLLEHDVKQIWKVSPSVCVWRLRTYDPKGLSVRQAETRRGSPQTKAFLRWVSSTCKPLLHPITGCTAHRFQLPSQQQTSSFSWDNKQYC